MSLPFDAVIFDLDGVIADTVELHYKATKSVTDEEGLFFNRKMNQEFQGMSRNVLIENIVMNAKRKYTKEEKLALGTQKNENYKLLIHMLSRNNILPGMYEFIVELKKNNVKLAVASSSTNAKTTLTNLEIIDFFDYVVDASSIKQMKPNPEIFLKAADKLKVPYEKCVAIEDSEAGMKAIKQTKMFSIGIGDNQAVREADWHLKSTEEITLNKLIDYFR